MCFLCIFDIFAHNSICVNVNVWEILSDALIECGSVLANGISFSYCLHVGLFRLRCDQSNWNSHFITYLNAHKSDLIKTTFFERQLFSFWAFCFQNACSSSPFRTCTAHENVWIVNKMTNSVKIKLFKKEKDREFIPITITDGPPNLKHTIWDN